MRIAVCDDAPSDRRTLLQYVEQYIGENYMDNVDLREYASAEALLAEKTMPELLFLDIYMEGISGMEAARRLLARGYAGGIIFTTSSAEFGAASYDVDALDYLVKPFSYQRFLKAVQRSDDRLRASLASITVPSGRQSEKIFLRELLYVETGSHCLLFHTKRETVKSPMTMAEAASALLTHTSFIRCHRSYLINLGEVEDVSDTTVLLTNGDRVLLNSKNAASLRRRIADHLWKGMETRHG